MLTHSKPLEKSTSRNGTCLVTPAIGLARLDKYSKAGKFDEKIKYRTNPSDDSSTTYEIRMAYFKEGSPEDWLLYKNRLARCLDRQGATGGPVKFALARRMLMGRALADFNNVASVRITETREHYLQCIHAVTLGVFPQDSLKEQKTWMRRFLKKTAKMGIKEYVARAVQINNYLPQFSPIVP